MNCTCGHVKQRHVSVWNPFRGSHVQCTGCTGPGRCIESCRSTTRRCLNENHTPCPCTQFEEKAA